ncbi:hypothetical protein TrRE_jg2819 [Triparma retinervis]|uniref:COMM domain-containing protein n=1 Tax=Triparma retinervis TaxID=2557542 RepID=A0A9W7E8J8_9STRA|nr:hypothetical protein TrRE_jg2819 [Triparma retinervis]
MVSFKHLGLLSSAPSKTALAATLNRTFLHASSTSPFVPATVGECLDAFGLSANQQEDLYNAMKKFVKDVLYQHNDAAKTAEYVKTILSGANLDDKIVNLLATLVPNLAASWRAAAIEGKVSPPRLDPDNIAWRVSQPSGSATGVSGASKVTLSLGVEDNGENKNISIELDKAGVDTFLDGLTKIKDQLSKV